MGAKYTRRHFVEIAALIAQMSPRTRRAQAEKFADVFAASNPAFKRAKFMRACGVNPRRTGARAPCA